MAGQGSHASCGNYPDWKQPDHYAALTRVDRRAFAWEWLRRTPAYRAAWRDRNSDVLPLVASRHFGLEQFEDPSLPAPFARPVWSGSVDPTVIRAAVDNAMAASNERIDLRELAPFVSVAIDDDHIEHLLLSDGVRSVRIDVLEGTLIGVPASVRYLLGGIASIAAPLPSLGRLINLVQEGRLRESAAATSRRQARWILELRTADAIAAGADQQDIARTLFGSVVADQRWRRDNAAYRQRAQRLVRSARQRLVAPLDQRWFEPPR